MHVVPVVPMGSSVPSVRLSEKSEEDGEKKRKEKGQRRGERYQKEATGYHKGRYLEGTHHSSLFHLSLDSTGAVVLTRPPPSSPQQPSEDRDRQDTEIQMEMICMNY